MKYDAFKSIVGSRKQPIELQRPSDSFFVMPTRIAPYIEPSFSKVDFPKEKPAILLVSAVGASGKTTTARALSFDTQLPILDLAKHKAVGADALTGILTSAYPIEKVGPVLEGLRSGTHGIIIDGIDEARSKTTEQAFEAFLDDLIERSKGSDGSTIVVLGRSQVLLSTWCYLVDKEVDVGMVQIDPFDLDQARSYIDAMVSERDTGQQENYEQARDGILSRLSAAFQSTAKTGAESTFLSFIGYPPVLDAIATLLRKEPNYHRIQQALKDGTGAQLEIQLLIDISDYLLDREHEEKAVPNFVDAIVADAGDRYGKELRQTLFDTEEQCARVLSRALSRAFPRQVIGDSALNERYERSVATFCTDHPFLDDVRVRNAVFAAVATARCALSGISEYRTLAYDYAAANRPTYHLLYIVAVLAETREVSVNCFNMLIQSCSEFLGLNAEISVDIDGDSWEEDPGKDNTAELTINIEFPEKNHKRTFMFKGVVDTQTIPLGPYLINTKVTLPCHIDLSNISAIEAIGDCSISAEVVHVDAPDLIVRGLLQRSQGETKGDTGLFIDARKVEGHAGMVSLAGGKIEIQCVEHSLVYPLAKYARKVTPMHADPTLREKYRRLRRILSEFASHSRGGLGKYRDKIEHGRVLKNDTGKKILDALVREHVLRPDPKFYFVDPDRFDAKLGISWPQLRQYQSSAKLDMFLRRVS